MDELEPPRGYVTVNEPRRPCRFHWQVSCQCHPHGDTYTLGEAWARIVRHLSVVHHIGPLP